MTLGDNTEIIKCPTCLTHIYRYNQHQCASCDKLVCFYCEARPCADQHQPPKEEETDGNETTERERTTD